MLRRLKRIIHLLRETQPAPRPEARPCFRVVVRTGFDKFVAYDNCTLEQADAHVADLRACGATAWVQ